MDIFKDLSLKLKEIGTLKNKTSKEIESSPICIGFETLDRDMFKEDKCYDLFAKSGAKWARCQTGWSKCETSRGIYDFAWLDKTIDNLLKRGIQPWFNLGYGNILYMPDVTHKSAVGYVPTEYGDECLQAWKNYVKALVVHFKDRVKHWEIWNEPNLDCFWRPSQASGKNYSGLVAITSPIIKGVDPNAKTVGCCGAGVAAALPFILQALKHGIGKHLDYYAVHPYGSIPELDYISSMRNLQRLLRNYAPHMKIWQGECGYPSQTYDHHDQWMGLYRADEESQAKYVIRRIMLDSMLNLELIAYFHISDLMEEVYRQADGTARPPVMLGLLNGLKYTAKKSYYALRNLSVIFDGETKSDDLSCIINIENYQLRQAGAIPMLSIVSGNFIRQGYPLYAYYYPEDLQQNWVGINNVTLKGIHETESKLSDPVLIDPLTGRVFEVTAWETGEYEFNIKGLPLTDYPLIITDKKAIAIA
jgi:hypothetical protein